MKLSSKLMLLIFLIILLLSGSLGTYAISSMNSQISHIAEQKMVSNIAIATALINEKYPGDWQLKEGKLYKGAALIDDNHKLAGSIGELTGDEIMIYKGNKGIALSSKNEQDMEHKEITLEPTLETMVLKEGKPYVGESHKGTELAVYEPIRSKDGAVIGVFHISMAKEMYNQAMKNFRQNIIWFTVIGLFIAILLAYFFSKRIIRPLIHLTRIVQKVSDGDLTHEKISVSSKDELGLLGEAFNHMIENLHTIVLKVRLTSEQVKEVSGSVKLHMSQLSDAAGQVDKSVRLVANGAEKQVLGMGQSSLAVEEILTSIKHIVETSSQVATASDNMAQQAEYGNEYVQKAITEIGNLNTSTNMAAKKITQLSEKSDSIGSIATMISKLSAQTNLLSLNASIEAARAGEEGRGFAVVAREVKKLAEQSEQSAKEIGALIETVQRTTSEAVEVMNNGLQQLDNGNSVILQAGTAFEQIINSSRTMTVQNKQVYEATKEISLGTQQISNSILEVTNIAENTSSNIQEIVRTSDIQVQTLTEITEASETMFESVEAMKTTISLFII
ncbi:MAG: methyl-accepting chemotaxis protein [Paenibacillus sp.]|nr:methyl-accepting chemotaxis protein [Paenibacillus sp.]